MPRFAAFLRAVNVGGTGKLPMAELKAMCEALGFTEVQTYFASGNVVFDADLSSQAVRAKLEARLADYAGKTLACFVRSAADLRAIVEANPFPTAEGNRLMVVLLDQPLAAAALGEARNRVDEEFALAPGCVFVHYPSGMGTSKLKIKGLEQGTARNLNTIRKMLEMVGG